MTGLSSVSLRPVSLTRISRNAALKPCWRWRSSSRDVTVAPASYSPLTSAAQATGVSNNSSDTQQARAWTVESVQKTGNFMEMMITDWRWGLHQPGWPDKIG
jgi:hypothetical protein